MKKRDIGRLCLLSIVAVLFSFCDNRAGAQEAAEQKPISIYVHLGFGDETDAQYSYIYEDIFTTTFREIDLPGEYRFFMDPDEYVEAVETDHPTAIYAGNREHLIHFIADLGYEPVWSYTTYGLDDFSSCIYVNKDSGIENVEGLRGKTISMNNSAFEYILLRGITDNAPEEFFSDIEPTKIGPAPAYSMKLEGLDSMFLSEQIFEFLHRNSPGLVAGLEKLECSFQYEFLPVAVSKEADPGIIDKIDRVLQGIINGKVRIKSVSFLKFQEFGKAYVTAENYRNIIDYYKQAEEKGWLEDYRKWLKSLDD